MVAQRSCAQTLGRLPVDGVQLLVWCEQLRDLAFDRRQFVAEPLDASTVPRRRAVCGGQLVIESKAQTSQLLEVHLIAPEGCEPVSRSDPRPETPSLETPIRGP